MDSSDLGNNVISQEINGLLNIDWIRGKHMKAFNFYKEKDMKEVDIIIDSPVRFEDAKKDYVQVKIGSLTVPVISIKGLIKMKKESGRPVDRLDIETLNAIQKLKRRKRRYFGSCAGLNEV